MLREPGSGARNVVFFFFFLFLNVFEKETFISFVWLISNLHDKTWTQRCTIDYKL